MTAIVLHTKRLQSDRVLVSRYPAYLLTSIIQMTGLLMKMVDLYPRGLQCPRFPTLGRLQDHKLFYPVPSYASMMSCKEPRCKYSLIIITVKGDLVSTHTGLARANFPTITPS